MTLFRRLPFLRLLSGATLALACSTPPLALADSFTSSASSAGSASSGSVSDSIGASSDSSGNDKRVAAGQYRVIDVAAAPGKPETTRMTLRAAAPAPGATHEFHLDVPNQALARRAVNTGELVQVNQRAYGYEFAHASDNQSFFLALQDDWYRELGSQKVAI